MTQATHLDLCSGIGGFTIAAHWAGFETVGFSEVEPYCCALLAQHWPEVPNYGDLRTADFSHLRGHIDVLSAGVPCQPASLAGKRGGSRDERWLWEAVLDVVGSVQPAWTIFENPDGILSLGEFGGVLLRLGTLGYEVRLFRVPANAAGAKHRRERVFIVAHRNDSGRPMQFGVVAGETSLLEAERTGSATATRGGSQAANSALAHADGSRSQRQQREQESSCVRRRFAEQSATALADADQFDDDGSGLGTGALRWEQREKTSLSASQALADADGPRCRRNQEQHSGGSDSELQAARSCSLPETLADADRAGLEEHQSWQSGQLAAFERSSGTGRQGEFEPGICGSADDVSDWPYPLTTKRIPNRSHRLKALGNACVPAQAHPFFEAIREVL